MLTAIQFDASSAGIIGSGCIDGSRKTKSIRSTAMINFIAKRDVANSALVITLFS